MKCPSESTESVTSWFLFLYIWQSTLALLPLSLLRFVRLNFWAVFTELSRFLVVAGERGFFYPSPRICSSFQNREEPQAYFEKRFFLLLALQKVKMVLLKTLWQFDDSCYGYVEAKQYHFMHKCNSTLYYTHFEITGGPCNLIGSNWCDLFTNRTIFCFKSHLFPSQWGGYTKNKTTNQISRLV